MIPKIIHYCWFGGKPMPENDAAYVEGWKRILSNYQFILWNEQNFDINTVLFTQQVANVKKWGFIVDYIRAWAVFHYGGIYLDTDVELLKPLDDLLVDNRCFGGFENERFVNPGSIFAGEKGCCIAKEIMNFYSTYNFIQNDGKLNLTPSPKILTEILLKHGFVQNGTYQILTEGIFTAYPIDYFCPLSFKTGQLKITENTYSIHHYDGTWLSKIEKKYITIRYKIFKQFGDNQFSKRLISFIYIIKRIETEGIFLTIKYYYRRLFKNHGYYP
jgi:mannosyltransferase OCH1-like enzyme